ncbi:hypothetical protein [Thioalkalivibrio sp. ALJ20]|nr:hypothetical protein [Thioalkalivibrio sp. ALJ20]
MNLTEVGVNPDRAYSDHPGYVALSPLGGLAGIENLTMIATSFSSDGLLVSATAAYTQESWIPIKRALNNLYGEPRRIDDNHLEYMSESGIHIRAQRSPVQPTGTLMPSIAYRTPKYVEWQLNRDKAELSDQF